MVTTIWIVKGLLALLFVMVGAMKLTMPKTALLEKGMKGLAEISEQQIKGIGFLEILGGVGVILPGLLNFYPVLSGVAAIGLALTMVVAMLVHVKLKLPAAPNVILLALCLFVVYAEFLF